MKTPAKAELICTAPENFCYIEQLLAEQAEKIEELMRQITRLSVEVEDICQIAVAILKNTHRDPVATSPAQGKGDAIDLAAFRRHLNQGYAMLKRFEERGVR